MKLGPWTERAVKIIDPRVQEQFVLDPLDALTTGMRLTVRAVDSLSSSRGDGGFCDGMSFLDDGVILYAPTPNSRRQNFTLAHELGHWVVEQDQGLFDWIADQADPPALLETVCDQIAQRLLLPAALTTEIVGADLVRAQHVQGLFDNSQASYQACAIAIARRIRGLGAVVLINRFDGQVAHASIQPDADDGWPVVYPWRGQTAGRDRVSGSLRRDRSRGGLHRLLHAHPAPPSGRAWSNLSQCVSLLKRLHSRRRSAAGACRTRARPVRSAATPARPATEGALGPAGPVADLRTTRPAPVLRHERGSQ